MEMWHDARRRGYKHGFRIFRKDWRTTISKGVSESLRASYPETAYELARKFVDEISKIIGVVCFSCHFDSILMWSHYTASHKGVVYEFDANHPLLSLSNGMVKVEYRNERATVDYTRQFDSDLANELSKLTKTKSIHWEYEGEFRQIHHLSKTQLVIEGTNHYHYIHFPKEMLTKIILGCRTDRQFEAEIRSYIKKHQLSVKLQRAEIDNSKFELTFIDLQ